MVRFIILILLMIAVPAAGYALATTVQQSLDADLMSKGLPATAELCAVDAGSTARQSLCAQATRLDILKWSSLIIGIIGVLLPMIFWMTARFVGPDRDRLAVVFPPLVRISLVLVAIIMAVQGAILTYGAYLGETYYTGKFHVILIGSIGLCAAYIVFELARSVTRLGGRAILPIAGKLLAPEDYPKLHGAVGVLAQKLGARPPTHIVACLEPNFFATSAKIVTPHLDEPVEGETLCVSLPLARLLSLQEFVSVVGHELGHFRGDDTAYSLRFAPIYAGLGSAMASMEEARSDDTFMTIITMPANSLLAFMHQAFANNERAVSREREFAADRAAAEVAPPSSFGRALVKVSLFSFLWDHVRGENVERLNKGLATRNLSMTFSNKIQYDIDHGKVKLGIDDLLKMETPHPTDTHPPTAARLDALGIDKSSIVMADLGISSDAAVAMFDNAQALEEELTEMEHHLMVSSGFAAPPENEERSDEEQADDMFLRGLYVLTARLVTADGHVDDTEIACTEDICRQHFENFDPTDFRECCYHPDDLPSLKDTLDLLSAMCTPDGKQLILKMLDEIANADDHLADEEMTIIAQTRMAFARSPEEQAADQAGEPQSGAA